MGMDWDEIETIQDLLEEDAIEEVRRDYADDTLLAARAIAAYLAYYEASAAISFESTNPKSPYLWKINGFTKKAERHRWYTVALIHGMVVDVLESDDVVPLPEFISRLKMSNLMIDAEVVLRQGEGEAIGLKELRALCRGRQA